MIAAPCVGDSLGANEGESDGESVGDGVGFFVVGNDVGSLVVGAALGYERDWLPRLEGPQSAAPLGP